MIFHNETPDDNAPPDYYSNPEPKKVIVKKYLSNRFLSKSIYPLGWTAKMDNYISNLPSGTPDQADEYMDEDEFEAERERRELSKENQNRHEL